MAKVPREIGDQELFVRFLFDTNFKKKESIADKLLDGETFLPLHGGVSMQRSGYCDEQRCIEYALEIPKVFAGFILLKKEVFEAVKLAFREGRPDFDAEIRATPLDEERDLVEDHIEVYTDSVGNPAHCDLIYINPAPLPEEEGKPKIAMRSFSKKLCAKCEILLEVVSEGNYAGPDFADFQ
jgi:hypothetical protein